MLLANNTFDLPFSKLSISMAVDLQLVSQMGLEVQSDLTSNVCIRYELGPVELQVALYGSVGHSCSSIPSGKRLQKTMV